MVTVKNSVMYSEAAAELILCILIDIMANIDLKAFEPDTYGKLGGSLERAKANIMFTQIHPVAVYLW